MTQEEKLIPDRTEVPLRMVPLLLWVSIAFWCAFIALGFYSQSVHETMRPYALLATFEQRLLGGYLARLVGEAFQSVMGSTPVLSGLVMLWIAFLSPRWSDRMLWSAAMIFTSYELALDATYLFPHKEMGEVLHPFPRVSAVVGLVAYGGWLLILPASMLPIWLKRTLMAVSALAVLTIVAYPLIDAYTRTIDTLGAIAFALALFSLGLFVAGRVGVNLLSSKQD